MPPRRRRTVLAVAAGAGGALLAGCGHGGRLSTFGAPSGATRQSQSFLHLWQGDVIASFVVLALVWGLIIWSVVRYRRRRGDDSLPRQTRYHIPMEITYTAIPVVIVAVIFGFTVHAENRIDHLSANPAATVRVEGFQWGWRFTYFRAPGVTARTVSGTQNQNPTLVLPVGETVRLELVSDDVIHSFFVPDFDFKRDLIPGVDNKVDFFIDREGTYPGHCAEFCGLYHTTMNFTVQAVPRQQFDVMLQGGGP